MKVQNIEIISQSLYFKLHYKKSYTIVSLAEIYKWKSQLIVKNKKDRQKTKQEQSGDKSSFV